MKNCMLLFVGILMLTITQSSWSYETWTSTSGSTIEARLLERDASGNYVLKTRDGQIKKIKPVDLNKESQIRAAEIIASAPDPNEPSTTSSNGKTGKASFFGTVGGGGSGSSPTPTTTPNSTPTPTTPTTTYVPDYQSQSKSLAGTNWSGVSPWQGSKTIIKMQVNADKVNWKGKSNLDMKYKQTGPGKYEVQGKNYKVFLNLVDDRTMKVSIGKSGKHNSTFHRK